MEVKKMPDGHSIFAFNDHENPSVFGFVPERSPAALLQEGAKWREVVGWEFAPTAEPRSWIDAEVRKGLQIRGYQVIDLLNSAQ